MKKIIIGILLFASINGTVKAANDWYVCDVKTVGAVGTTSTLLLLDGCDCAQAIDCSLPEASVNWVSVINQKNQALATILTAISLDSQLKLQINNNGTTYPPVNTIYLTK